MNREEFDALSREVIDYQARLSEWQRHGRGGTTLGEMIDSGALAEGFVRLVSDPSFQQREVRRNLKRWLGDPEQEWEYSRERGMLYNIYNVCINLVGGASEEYVPDPLTAGPAELGARAGRVLTERKARTRIERLRETARQAGKLADDYEKRLDEERAIRPIR
jgi:hypothetical protein